MKCSHSLRGRPWGLTRLTWWMESWQPSLHWNEKRCVGQSQVSDNDLQHVRETAFHKPRTTLHLVSVPSKELYAKTPGNSFPKNSNFLELVERRRHQTGDCGKQGGRGRPEEVISQINHFLVLLKRGRHRTKDCWKQGAREKARRSHLHDQSYFLVLLREAASSQSRSKKIPDFQV